MPAQDERTPGDEDVKSMELRVRELEAEKALAAAQAPWWRRADPLVLAICATALTLLGNMAVTLLNNGASVAQERRRADDDMTLESRKARYNLVLQAMATNDATVAKRNIHFFIDAGLLEDSDCRIEDAIERDSPVLPSLSGSAPALGANVHSALEIANLYDFPPGTDGRGQTIGLVEFGGGFTQADLTAYFTQLSLPTPDITIVPVDGGDNRPGDDSDIQVTSDIEIAGAIAPGARMRVYFAPVERLGAGFSDVIARAVDDHVSVLSMGWGQPESAWSDADLQFVEAALARAARADVTVIASSRDFGASDGVTDGPRHVEYPASSPWVLAVGGTSLKARDGRITSETIWGSPTAASGGGLSARFARPVWQVGVAMPAPVGAPGRRIPDVVASADPSLGYGVRVGGRETAIGGPSPAASLWAGLIARINQAAGQNVGWLNPRLYRGLGASGAFHAITQGNNPGFKAGPGWTPAAGWGSPDGQKIVEWLRSHQGRGKSRNCGGTETPAKTAKGLTLWGLRFW